MSSTYWIITGILFTLILIVGTWRFRRPLFIGVKYKLEPNSDERSARWLNDHIKTAKDTIEAVTGNLNPYVFNSVVEAIESRLRDCERLQIKILVGPEIFTLQNQNELFKLALKFKQTSFERFEIGFLPERPEDHFRVVDYTHVYAERPHPPGTDERMAESWENSVFKAWEYHTKFEELWRERDVGIIPKFIPIEPIKQQNPGGESCQS